MAFSLPLLLAVLGVDALAALELEAAGGCLLASSAPCSPLARFQLNLMRLPACDLDSLAKGQKRRHTSVPDPNFPWAAIPLNFDTGPYTPLTIMMCTRLRSPWRCRGSRICI